MGWGWGGVSRRRKGGVCRAPSFLKEYQLNENMAASAHRPMKSFVREREKRRGGRGGGRGERKRA